ncbi:MAG TPA: hypothetical protein VFE65_07585 [Pseudonocardia sp.]|jgi:hypothetical protein|nr:hypothetical protein [Pseudonocardia sp.]
MTRGRRIALIVSGVAVAGLGFGGLASAHSHHGHHGHHHGDQHVSRQNDTRSDSWVGSDYGFNGFGNMFKNMDMTPNH